MEKIILTVTNDLSYDQRMIRICTSLSNAGYDVLLVGRKRKDSVPLIKRNFQQLRLQCFFEKGKFFYLEYNLRLLMFLLRQSFDALCAIDLDTILPCLTASRLRSKTCIYDAHEYFTEVPEVKRRPAIRKVWTMVANWTIPRIPYAYTVCESLAEIFEKKYGIPFEVIRNVPFSRKEKIQPANPPIVLYQGALNEGRGLEQCIHAMQQIEGAELWLAGEGDLSDSLRILVEKLHLQNKVKFLGYLQPEDLKEVTLKATIGLNLLENKGLSYYYSLANKAFDYIQVGLPSLHMDFPEYRKINETYEVFHLLPDLNIETIRASIQYLLQDKTAYQRFQENCLKARISLNWEQEEQKLLRFYQQVFA
jgi:glycosyltransferase involved in cell wall biosynthesis